jgi:hypothetical protein
VFGPDNPDVLGDGMKILDEAGVVRHREGEHVDGACVVGQDGEVSIAGSDTVTVNPEQSP